MRACYICGRDEIENLEVDKDRIAKKSDNLLVYRGIDLYSKNSSIEAMNYGYDFYIYDLGVLSEQNIDNFTSKDVKILVGGLKYWEMPQTIPILARFESSLELNHIFNFCSDEIKKNGKNIIIIHIFQNMHLIHLLQMSIRRHIIKYSKII